jgi:hypothetical protein
MCTSLHTAQIPNAQLFKDFAAKFPKMQGAEKSELQSSETVLLFLDQGVKNATYWNIKALRTCSCVFLVRVAKWRANLVLLAVQGFNNRESSLLKQ